MDKKIQIILQCIFAFFGIYASRRFLRNFKRFLDIKFYNKINDIPLTLSESQQYLIDNPLTKYLLLTGHILPTDQQQKRFLWLKCFSKNKTVYKVSEFQLLDTLHNQRQNITINNNSVLLPVLIDYNKTYQYQKQSSSFLQKVVNKLPYFGKNSKVVETHQGIQFGQFTSMLCEKDGENLNLLYISNHNYQRIYNQLFKDTLFQLSFLFFTSIKIIQLTNSIVQYLKKKKEQNKLQEMPPPPLFKNSVSILLSSQNDQDICVICLSKTRSIILEPCLHFIVCQDCVDHLDKEICPFCRISIEKKIKVVYQQ